MSNAVQEKHQCKHPFPLDVEFENFLGSVLKLKVITLSQQNHGRSQENKAQKIA